MLDVRSLSEERSDGGVDFRWPSLIKVKILAFVFLKDKL